MTLLWLFMLLWVVGWALAQLLVPAAIGWQNRYPGNTQSQPRRILLVCALPWLIAGMATLAMLSMAAAKNWGWLHDHCLFHSPHHPHFCFEHLPEILLGHGHIHVLVTTALFAVLAMQLIRHWRALRREAGQLNALTALSKGRGLLRLVDDSGVVAFAASPKQTHIYLSRGLVRQLNFRERRMVLAHEAAHIRRRDLLLSRCVELLLLLHVSPCAQRLRRMWRDAIEARADEHVAKRFGRIETAELLLRLAKSMRPVPSPVALNGGEPVARIHKLLRDEPSTQQDSPLFEALVGVGLLALMIGLFVSHHDFETLLGVLISL